MARHMTMAVVLALFAGAMADEIVWSGNVTIPANADVTCTDHSAVTSLSIGSGATVRFETDTPHNFAISGTGGKIVKASAAKWVMSYGISSFNGDYEIAAGVVSNNIECAFGANSEDYKVSVAPGATLMLGKSGTMSYRNIHFAGVGASGQKGAIEFPAATLTGSTWNRLHLDADATAYCPGLFFLRNSLNLNGHRLTVCGGGNPTIFQAGNVSADGEVYLQASADGNPTLTFRTDKHSYPIYGTDAGQGPFILSGNTKLAIYNGYKPIDRPMWVSGMNNVFHHAANGNTDPDDVSCNTNHANWAGAVVFTNLTNSSEMQELQVFNGTEKSYSKPPCTMVVSGPISGPGLLKTYIDYSSNRVAILNANNTYTGGTFIDGKTTAAATSTVLGYPGTIPNQDFASVTARVAFVDLAVADDCSRWDWDSAMRFIANATFPRSGSRVRFSSEFTTNGAGPVKLELKANTPTLSDYYLSAIDAVRFEGAGNETPIPFNWCAGTAYLAGPQPMLLGQTNLRFTGNEAASSAVRIVEGADVTLDIASDLYVGASGSSFAQMSVSNATLKNSDVERGSFSGGTWNKIRGGSIFVGYDSPGILEVLDGAVISNRIYVTPWSVTGANGSSAGAGVGVVYQRGGHVVALGTNAFLVTSGVGLPVSGCGYYELSGDGLLESRGNFHVGGYGYGCFAQYGGRVVISNMLTQAANVCNDNAFVIGSCNGGYGTLYIENGSFEVFSTNSVIFGQGNNACTVDLTLNGDGASFDLRSGALNVGSSTQSDVGTYCFNLNGGTFRAGGFRGYEYVNASMHNDLCVNFNGGTFRAGRNNVNLFGCGTTVERHWTTNVVVYAGGATIDTDGLTVRSDVPIKGAYGKGVKSITLPAPISGTNRLGPPRVRITGDGMGASAFAHFDSVNRVVDRIIVTSPGYGYTTATASLDFGAGNRDVVVLTSEEGGGIVLEDNANTGDFTKTGDGTLTLNKTNSWGGATVVAGGTLKAGCAWAIPSNTAVRVVGGGVLDLNSKAAKVASVEYGPGGGSIANALAGTLPASFSLRLSVEDVAAERPILLSGNQDLSGVTLTVEGDDYSCLDASRRSYRVLQLTDGGVLSGAPAVDAVLPPEPWRYITCSDGVMLRRIKGSVFLLK